MTRQGRRGLRKTRNAAGVTARPALTGQARPGIPPGVDPATKLAAAQAAAERKNNRKDR